MDDPGGLEANIGVNDEYTVYNYGSGVGHPGCCTQAEFDAKSEVDLTGNLADAKMRNAVSVINFILSKYVGDLKWDFLIYGHGAEMLKPYDNGLTGPGATPQDITEGICGIISLGAATDCQGFVNRMQYLQQLDKDILFFDCVDVSSNLKGIYEVECSEGLILLGRTIPSLPCTLHGNAVLEQLGFRIAGERRFKFPSQVSIALPAKIDSSVEHGKNDRVMIEGCTNPDSLMSRLARSSKGCAVIPIDRNIDWCSQESYDICMKNFMGSTSALWFSSPCAGGSMWSFINMHRGSSAVALILGHWAEFNKLWKRFEAVATKVIPLGVAMFIEWPRGCRYWTHSCCPIPEEAWLSIRRLRRLHVRSCRY